MNKSKKDVGKATPLEPEVIEKPAPRLPVPFEEISHFIVDTGGKVIKLVAGHTEYTLGYELLIKDLV